MTKRILLLGLVCFASSAAVLGQQFDPWNCKVSGNLICLVPVSTHSTGLVNSPATAFNSAFATQLSNLPIVSSASGIGISLTAAGTPVTTEENLGPILTDRAETIGRHKLFVGFFYQRFRFNSIDGTSLNSVPFFFSNTTGTGNQQSTQDIVETEHIDFKLDQYVGLVTFGLTSKTDVTVVIPIERVSIGAGTTGTQYFVGPNNTQQGSFNFSTYLAGSASGIGDVVANVKNTFWNGERFKFAAGAFLRFPSGDALNYLGSGAFGFNPYAVVSYQWKVAPHAKLAYTWNTSTILIPNQNGGNSRLPGGFQYDVGADWGINLHVTIAGDFLGSQFLNSPALTLTTNNSIPAYNVTNIHSLQPVTNSYQVNYFSLGGKYRPVGNLILYANALFQLNNVGLRSNIVPLFGISYKFGK